MVWAPLCSQRLAWSWSLRRPRVCMDYMIGPWLIRDSDEGAAGSSSLAGLPGMAAACLGKPLSFPDIPRLSWPQERGQRGRAPALCVACGGWQEGSDHEAGGPPWLSGSRLPITQHLVSRWSGALSDHQHTALWGAAKSGAGLMLSARTRLKFDFPLSTSHTCLSNGR